MSEFTITKMQRHPDGHWTARLSCPVRTVDVDNRFGSWMADVRAAKHSRDFVRRCVLPEPAAELAKRVKQLERKVAKETNDG